MKETLISVFKDLFKSTDVPYIITLEKSLERIKRGTSKNLIVEIRKGNKELKKKLPSILFAGEFQERKRSGLIKHSGMMVVDFDKYPNNEVMLKHLELLKKNRHFITLFISPSGNGIKGVVRVPNFLDKDSHPKYFKAFAKAYDYEYFDMANSNVDRVCFESYDPNIYINYNAKEFESEIEDDGYDRVERAPLLPITNEDVIINKIMQWNWKRDFIDGERNAFIFDIAGAFCEYGISESTANGYILNNIVYGDFTEREMTATISSAYKSRDYNSKYFEDYTKVSRIKNDLNKGKDRVISEHKISEEQYESISDEKETEDFWYFDKNDKPKIDPFKYKNFLERNGFKKYFPNGSQKPTWVYVQSNKVVETSVERLKDFVLDNLLNNGEVEVWKYCVNYGNMFSEIFLTMLSSIELDMLRDNKCESFIAYQNGILKISKDKAELIDYIDVDGYVWESQIIKRDFIKTETNTNEYQKFISNISSEDPLPFECVIGYLLSTYKNKTNNKAIILNDEVISDNPEGGTGKGLFVQGLRQIRKVAILDGKSFDDKKSFPYQTVSQDSQVLVWDDVKRNFDFESKFSLVTEGITIERKNKDAIKLSVEESPKILISTNYAIKGAGNSHDRRRHEMEVSQYYGDKITPYNEFGHQLFDDWSDDMYGRFDNYMVHCIQKYLLHGLISQTAKNIKLRKFIAETSMEFYEWMEEDGIFPLNIRKTKSEAFAEFIQDNPDYQKWLKRKTFNVWIRKYASFKGLIYRDGRSGNDKWIVLSAEKGGGELDKIDDIQF